MVSRHFPSNPLLLVCSELSHFLLIPPHYNIFSGIKDEKKHRTENILSIFSAMDIHFSTEPIQKPSVDDEAGLVPKLIDPTALYYLDGALKKSHTIRVKYHRIIWNVGIVFTLCFFLGGFLYYRYSTRPTEKESNYKLIKDQEYVLSKIRYFQEQNQRINESKRTANGSEISGLPVVHPN